MFQDFECNMPLFVPNISPEKLHGFAILIIRFEIISNKLVVVDKDEIM